MTSLYTYLFLTTLLTSIYADYDCVCNYNVEWKVQSKASDDATVLGYLYEFDCKQSLHIEVEGGEWFTVAYEKQVGYVHKDTHQNVVEQVCAGEPSSADIVTTTLTPPSTKETVPKSVSTQTTTARMVKTTERLNTPVPNTTRKTTARQTTTSIPTSTTSVRIITEKHTTPIKLTTSTSSSTTSPTSTTTAITTTKKLTPSTTPSTTTSTSTTTTTTTTTTTASPTTHRTIISGNSHLCSTILRQYTIEDQGALTQYDDRCFELVPIRTIWAKAESDCRAKGGHLFHIDSKEMQDFIYKWIKSYKFDHAVWTGLTDVINEEYFEWVTGDHLLYTNWYPDRYGNLASHHLENCVLLVPYAPYYGQWDDVQCGLSTQFGDSGQQNPFICEYSINLQHPSNTNIIVG